MPTYADSTAGDKPFGEDLSVRSAAVQALAPYNGSVIAVDPANGRVLSMVNQKLALGSGFQPCSTIKLSIALAALSEKLIDPGTQVQVSGRRMNLTYALAHSDNWFFADLGLGLGFERIRQYASRLGYGEKAGFDILGEEAGTFPVKPPLNGGVSMLASFGEEVSQTPLELAALMAAIANGGTLYGLQYPRNALEASRLVPRVKRRLNLEAPIAGILDGLREAVQSGTARSARQEEPIAGKTGTCTEDHGRLGWFGSFNSTGRRLVVVALVRGGRQATGARAAAIAGEVYRRLRTDNRLARTVR